MNYIKESVIDTEEKDKKILQGELQNYCPSGWNIPGNYSSWTEYMLKSFWYAGIARKSRKSI